MFDNIEKTSLVHSVETNNIEKVEIIINHSSFDIEKSDVIIAIFIAAKDNNIEIFKKLIKLINNVNICDPLYGYNLLVFAAENLSGNIIDEIFKYDFNFNSYQIVEAFVKSYTNITKTAINQFFNKNTAIEIMNKIFDYDMNHAHLINFSKLLKNGKSFFTSIESNYYGTGDVSDFLLNHGVDPNMPDEEGVFPLQHAIQINSSIFLESLINSNRIVYSQLPKGNSYLHFSISCLNYQATKTFIERKLIDINTVNDNGETPLMEACKKLDINGINLLFQQDNLDYLHLDKKGNDALKIIELLPPDEVENTKQSKENYHNKIITLIHEKLDKTEPDYFY